MATRTSVEWRSKGIEVKEDTPLNKDTLADIILNIDYQHINYGLLMDTFGEFKGKSLASSYDILVVPKNTFKYIDFDNKEKSNNNEFTTTFGLYIFNKILSHFNFSKLFNGYINYTINKKSFKKIENRLSYALIEDDITIEQLKGWENTVQWLMPMEDILSPNHTEKVLTCTTAINKKKNELLKQYKTEIEAGDAAIAEKIEKELLDFAKDYLKDDPYYDTIEAGVGADLGNNFKNMYVMRGAVANPDPTAKKKYDIVSGNFMDGIQADDYKVMAGAGVQGAYSRGKKTQDGGYMEQLFLYGYQHLHLDPKGSDCGTKRFITVFLDEDNIDKYMYSYIIRSNGSLERLDTKTRDKYINKTVNMRFSSKCQSKTGFCNMCAGDLLYTITDNIGAVMSKIPDTLKNTMMKSFHSLLIKTRKFDANRAFFS